jgi:Lrp/AsnC family transcriptional regulator, regulator for asnA, asnC and gidA
MRIIDELDRHIIRELQRDGRASNVDIARALNVTEGTIRKRLERLIDSDVIRVAALPDPSKIGYSTHTLISLQVDMAALDAVIEQLTRLPEICCLSYITGEFDLIIEALFADTNHLLRFLANEIGQIDGIRKTSTSHVLRVIKSPSEWEIPREEDLEVLIVDDDPDFVEFCRLILTKEGLRVTRASNGDEALAHMRVAKPDLVVLDVMMQGILDGLHTSRSMRADKDLGQVPILMVSSIADSSYAGMFPTDEYIPVNNFLTKPIDPKRFIAEVHRLIRR